MGWKIFKYALWLILGLVLFLVVLFLWNVDPMQNYAYEGKVFPESLQKYQNSKTAYDSLNQLYGHNKTLASGYELQCLLALSLYPELKEVSIDFIMTQDGAPMESSMEIPTLLLPRNSRKYLILLNDNDNSFLEPILLKKLPFESQVGILAHELGHTRYYHALSTPGIISWGLNYGLKPSYRALHERSTDEIVVYRGMGWQILDYAEFVRNDPSTVQLYQNGKIFMDTFYLTPKEIEQAMDESGMYLIDR